jgi:hypothetical protein
MAKHTIVIYYVRKRFRLKQCFMLKIAPYQQAIEKLSNYLQQNNSCVLSKVWSTKVFRLVAVL